MKEEYNLSTMKERRNPFARRLKKQITLRLNPEIIEYFKTLAEDKDIPYQSLINMYLLDCVNQHRDLKIEWA